MFFGLVCLTVDVSKIQSERLGMKVLTPMKPSNQSRKARTAPMMNIMAD